MESRADVYATVYHPHTLRAIDRLRPAHLYHGTLQRVDRIEPRPARGLNSEEDRLRAVYASHMRAYATAFALPIVPDRRGNLKWSLVLVNRQPRVSIEKGRLDMRRVGYVYRLSAEDFVPLDEFQWVSLTPVVPLDFMVVDPAKYADWIASAPTPARMNAKPRKDKDIDFDRLWQHVISTSRRLSSVHGPDHWQRVEQNALRLAARSGADVAVVRLFALFHDCRRRNDSRDDGHGKRGARLAERLRGSLFDLSDEKFEMLRCACTWHTDGRCHEDPTIGTCWDADRLDLVRVGVLPDPRFMSTAAGRELASRYLNRPTRARASHRNTVNWLSDYGGF